MLERGELCGTPCSPPPIGRHSYSVFRAALIGALATMTALGAPDAVLAHDVNTRAGHEAEDAVVHEALGGLAPGAT
jgi:hypothetical protein